MRNMKLTGAWAGYEFRNNTLVSPQGSTQRIFRLRSSSPARAVPAVNYPRLSANSGKVSASESESGRM